MTVASLSLTNDAFLERPWQITCVCNALTAFKIFSNMQQINVAKLFSNLWWIIVAAAMCHSLSPSVPECHNVFSDRPRSLTSALMSHMHTNTADSAGSSPDIHFPVLHSENVAAAVAEPDMGMPTWIEHAK